MKFSELSLIEKDIGLKFDSNRLSLIGEKLGYGIIISDSDNEYVVKVYAEKPYTCEQDIANGIVKLSESLSKNTINSQKCEYNFVEVNLNKDCLLQENIVLLIDFLDKLTEHLKNLGIKGKAAVLPPVIRTEERKITAKNLKKVRLSFDINSVKGLFGAFIGAAAMVFIASMSVRFKKASTTSLSGEIGAYIISSVTTALIFFDYRFLAKKLDPFGVVVCPALSLIAAVLSPLTVAAKSAALIEETTLAEGFGIITDLYGYSPDLASFTAGYLMKGVIITILCSILICVWYFNKYPEHMVKAEITEEKGDNKAKK